MSARYLADYMAATELRRRAIVRESKYHKIARVVQHNEAKLSIGKFLRSGKADVEQLISAAASLRRRLTDTDFDRDLLDHNADYIERFAKVALAIELPAAEVLIPGATPAMTLEGTKVTIDLACRLSRKTKTNKIRVGAVALRYAKGKILPAEIAAWQSALLLGYLKETQPDELEPEGKLCITLDAYSGICHEAPSDTVSKFKNMTAACATIAERWPNIAPPAGAVL